MRKEYGRKIWQNEQGKIIQQKKIEKVDEKQKHWNKIKTEIVVKKRYRK